jgi:hypothetical protein
MAVELRVCRDAVVAGWHLETAVVDSVEALAEWLARFENKS